MSDIEVRVLDRFDPAVLRAYWDLGKQAMTELPHDIWPAWDYARRYWAQETTESEVDVLGVLDGERLLGGAFTGRPLGDNEHLMHLELYVVADARRRGIGTALLGAAEEIGAAAGRTTYLSDAVVPVGGDGPGVRFAGVRGYSRVSRDECKVVDLEAVAADLPRLQSVASERLGGYRLISWEAPAPEEWIDDICALRSAFLGEVPLEDADLRPQEWTPERYRAREARWAAAGNRQLLVAAVAPDGTLVGYSDAHLSEGEMDRAEIGGTLVLPAHRGHRLGLALKVRLHQLLLELPETRTVMTFNAGINEHMNAVNELLGYRVLQHVIGVQKKV